MQKRKIDELISHFNRKVADMDIDREYKMELLGMITAIGIACEKELSIEPERKAGRWIPCSERLPEDVEIGEEYPTVIFCTDKATYAGFYEHYLDGKWWTEGDYTVDGVIAWMPLPEPYKGEQE